MRTGVLFLFTLCTLTIVSRSAAMEPISLPEPERDGGKPLMQALSDRQTSRSYSPEALSEQVVSNLLWAAFGINRPESGKRTAPSAMNWQEIDIYVSMADGLFLYNALEHALYPILSEDIRAATGAQSFVADYTRMGSVSTEDKDFYSGSKNYSGANGRVFFRLGAE